VSIDGKAAAPPLGLRMVRVLGRGGMGEVVLAARREGAFERIYAVKRLRPELLGDAEARTAFLDESRLAGLLYHPNLVRVFDVGEDQHGPYMTMEYVEGYSLGEVVRRCHGLEIDLPLSVALEIMRDVALGLRAAHEARDVRDQPLSLIHRDLSPENVLVGTDGIARLADFGIARAIGRATATTQAILKGKLGYMAPEQLRFEEPSQRSDLFSFGIVLYEILAGRRLYKGTEGARRILEEPQPDLLDERPDAPMELVGLLFELMAKPPESRPASAREVAQRMEQILAQVSMEEDLVLTRDFIAELSRPLDLADPTVPITTLPREMLETKT